MGRQISPNMIAALRHSDRTIISIHGTICEDCEDQCYAVGVRVSGEMGRGHWEDVIYRREHLDAATAWQAVGNEAHRYASALARAAMAEHLRETHPTLW